jgi:hypothetical protein
MPNANNRNEFERVYVVEKVFDRELKLHKWIVVDLRSVCRVKHFWSEEQACAFADKMNDNTWLRQARQYRASLGKVFVPCFTCARVMKPECSVMQECFKTV